MMPKIIVYWTLSIVQGFKDDTKFRKLIQFLKTSHCL